MLLKQIHGFELALRNNKAAAEKVANNPDPQARSEYRSLLLQRSVLKDKLLTAYRELVLGQIKKGEDNESLSGS